MAEKLDSSTISNIWKWLVTTLGLALVTGIPIAILTSYDTGSSSLIFQMGVVSVSGLFSALIVFSDGVFVRS